MTWLTGWTRSCAIMRQAQTKFDAQRQCTDEATVRFVAAQTAHETATHEA